MVAKAIMILFPVGVLLTLGYSATVFFNKSTTSTLKPAPTEQAVNTSSVIQYASTSLESEFIADIEKSTNKETATSTKKIDVPATTTKKITSASLLHLGQYGDGWASNSWGASIAREKKTASLGVFFHNPWDALSIYTTHEFLLNTHHSLEINLISTSLDPHTLFVSAYNNGTKLGSAPLYPYAVTETSELYRIPFEDILGTSTALTQITLESDRSQVIFVSEVRFSSAREKSRLQELPIPIIPTPTPEVITPAEQPTEIAPPTPVITPATINPYIYFNGVQAGWNVIARRGVVIETMGDENQSVTGNAIKMHFDKQDGSLSFEHAGGFQTKGYKNLHLKIYGGTTDRGWQQLIVTLYDKNGKKLGSSDVMMYSGNGRILMQTWNSADIPLRELGATDTTVMTIDIENVSVTEVGDHVWIDDVRFIGENE